MKFKGHLIIAMTSLLGVLSNHDARALGISPFTFFTALVSLTPTVVTIGSGAYIAHQGLSHDSNVATGTGALIGAGGLIMGALDPAAAFFYNGQFTQHYDPDLFSVRGFGWMGDWGVDPSLPALPIDSTLWAGNVVSLQAPDPALVTTVSNNESAGLFNVT